MSMSIKFPETDIINEDDAQYCTTFYRIALSPIGGWYGVFANSFDDCLEILGAWCDDNAPGYIVDTSEMSEEELEEGSYFFVNGAPDCALDLHECTHHMVEEYSFAVTFKKLR